MNQHWVPQYYFRMFSSGVPYIHSLVKSTNRTVRFSPIKGQCARRNFYGTPELEESLSNLESEDAGVLRRAIAYAWDPNRAIHSNDPMRLCRAVVFQRARTLSEATKRVASIGSLALHSFRHHLSNAVGIDNRGAQLRAVDSGRVRFEVTRQHAVKLAILAALRSSPFLLDLGVRLLRNRTDFPFIFGDAPVVFANPHLENVRSRGVLGLTSPGLVVIWPLDSQTMLLMFDEGAYEGYAVDSEIVDLVNRSDVSQLNALQLHNSEDVVYFGSESAAHYVEDLWAVHRSKIVRPTIQVQVRSDYLIDGERTDSPIIHSFEPQLRFSLALSVLRPRSLPGEPYEFRRRNPEAYAAIKEGMET